MLDYHLLMIFLPEQLQYKLVHVPKLRLGIQSIIYLNPQVRQPIQLAHPY